VNYFGECHRHLTTPDGQACMRVLKYPQLPALSGELNWLTIS